jgi:hypothetical protein
VTCLDLVKCFASGGKSARVMKKQWPIYCLEAAKQVGDKSGMEKS